MLSAEQEVVITCAFEIVEAWAHDPQASLDLIPRLCEALRALDADRFMDAFDAGRNL